MGAESSIAFGYSARNAPVSVVWLAGSQHASAGSIRAQGDSLRILCGFQSFCDDDRGDTAGDGIFAARRAAGGCQSQAGK